LWAERKRYITNTGHKWDELERNRHGWIKITSSTEHVQSSKKGAKGEGGTVNTVLLVSWLITFDMVIHIWVFHLVRSN
jgi:hypothetical protein